MSGALSSGDAGPMFDGQAMTRREVMIARDAMSVGIDLLFIQPEVNGLTCAGARDRAIAQIPELRPLPKIERPRVVRDPAGSYMSWRFVNNNLEVEHAMDYSWIVWDGVRPKPTNGRIKLWADLMENPTEMVDDVPPSPPSGSGT